VSSPPPRHVVVIPSRYVADVRNVLLVGPRGLRLRASVPTTPRERARGLLGRAVLARDEALLVRARSIHTFGMPFAIKVALLDEQLVAGTVRIMSPRRLLLPRPGVRYVLECSEHAEVRPGDRLQVVEPS